MTFTRRTTARFSYQYLWKAAEDLHPTHASRAAFVQTTARELLEGHAPRVVADLHAHLRSRGGDNPAPGLQRAAAHFKAKQPYLNYHIALALGWPIATGVIEGSCRYLVKDRLDITGARWSLTGAEAILLLRAVIANGDYGDGVVMPIGRRNRLADRACANG